MSVSAPTDEPITLPQHPVRSPPSPFPVMAAMAPVVASVLIWLVTRSSFALIFAALGPVIAIASVVDSRWSSGRRLKKDLAAYAIELERITAVIDSRLEDERRARRQSSPGARALVMPGVDAVQSVRFGRWRGVGAVRTRVVVGSGTLPSTIRVDGAMDSAEARALRARARVVSGVPVEVDATRGLGVVGPRLPARAFARGILLQLCNAMGPDTAEVRVDGPGWRWAADLPHSRAGYGATVRIEVSDRTTDAVKPEPENAAVPSASDTAVIRIVLAATIEEIPAFCGEVIELTGPATAVLHRSDESRHRGDGGSQPAALPITLELVSEVECEVFAHALAALAERLGISALPAELPGHISFSDAHRLAEDEGTTEPKNGNALSAVLGVDGAGAVHADIVRDGPHAIVGGTTGSGKSELLTTWIASMARQHLPEAVTFLLVDFKGGSAFAPLQRLPHVVGVLTDLDDVAATRALASLSAEILYRERMLAQLGCRDISDTHGVFPRLVIVVDEFAAMLDGFPELHALFVDIAARGRSLGMHLILCTQRPAGVVKDSLLANCGLRMSLRVHNRGDSVAVVGTDAAAALPQTPPGRLVLASGGRVALLQVATVSQAEIDEISERTPVGAEPRRPWLDPLPNRLRLADLDAVATGIRLGLADLPSQQRQDTAVWQPENDGSVLVIGTARSGKTTVLDTVTTELTAELTTEVTGTATDAVGAASGLPRWRLYRVGLDHEETWDTVTRLANGLRTGGGPESATRTIVLIDDLDSLLARLDDDYATRLRDAVVELLRDGPRRSVFLMVTLQRLAGPLGVLAGFAGTMLMLRMANRQEHLLTGGESATWVPGRAAGNAVWHGVTVQIATAATDGYANTPPHSGRAGPDDSSPARAQPTSAGPGRHRLSTTAPPYIVRNHHLTVMVTSSPQRRMEAILADNRSHPEREAVRVALIGSGTRITVSDLALDGSGAVVLIGDSDEWQSQWALFAALRQSADLVVDGCTVSEYRALTKRRDLPPLLGFSGHAWHVPPGGQPRRVAISSTSSP